MAISLLLSNREERGGVSHCHQSGLEREGQGACHPGYPPGHCLLPLHMGAWWVLHTSWRKPSIARILHIWKTGRTSQTALRGQELDGAGGAADRIWFPLQEAPGAFEKADMSSFPSWPLAPPLALALPPNAVVAVSHCGPELCRLVQEVFELGAALESEPRVWLTELRPQRLPGLLFLRQRPRTGPERVIPPHPLSGREYRPAPPGPATC